MKNPDEIRREIREGRYTKPTAGLAPGYVQANLVILKKAYAFDFLLFCQRNPKPCPVLEVLEPGVFLTQFMAHGADIRTDIPKYRVYRDGRLEGEVETIASLWQDDFVTFLLGCSFSFEEALLKNDIPVRHIEENRNVPMFKTSIPVQPAGIFRGNLVVTMRPIPEDLVVRAVQITTRYAMVHGAPVHIGRPEAIGITDLKRPDYGDPVTIREGEIPVFWACGVTPQAVIQKAKPDLVITHAPGHMLIGDIKNESLAIL
ncbi:MAG: putative hydro-lyase [Deltaproteobacteria bacterium]|nr:MAG: putative hydro-lyase [Deltaproteobacteria bacterium]